MQVVCSARPQVSARASLQSAPAAPALRALALRRREILFAAGGAALLPAAPAFALAEVGDVAPAFELPSTKDQPISLAGLVSAKPWTVLYFYNADGTTGCSLEAQRFQQALPAFASADAQVIGVSMDNLSKHTEFCTDKKLTFPLLSDATGEVSKSYGADLSIPFLGKFSDRQTFLINAKGVIVAKWKEQDGSMASVKTPAHTEQILAAIAAQKA